MLKTLTAATVAIFSLAAWFAEDPIVAAGGVARQRVMKDHKNIGFARSRSTKKQLRRRLDRLMRER